MNEPDAANEHVVETESGERNQLNPHLGHMDPDQAKPPESEQEADEDGEGESPAPVDGDDEKESSSEDDSALQKKFAELAFENRQLKRQIEAQQARSEDEPGEAEPLKTLKDFEYDEQAFNRYLIGVAKDEAKKEALAETQKSTVQTEAQRRADEFAAREDAFETERPGFKERLHSDNLHISQEMAAFIMDPTSEVGLHIGDYLASNPTEAAKIALLPETAQAREMVKLESRIAKEVAKAKAEKSKASKAPEPPVNTVDGTDPGMGLNPTNPTDADSMSDEEWQKARNKQLERKRKRA